MAKQMNICFKANVTKCAIYINYISKCLQKNVLPDRFCVNMNDTSLTLFKIKY